MSVLVTFDVAVSDVLDVLVHVRFWMYWSMSDEAFKVLEEV